MQDIVCLRQGELAADPRQTSPIPLEGELLKIRGRGSSWECIYFQAETKACAIYAHRPAQCEALSCQDTRDVFLVMESHSLSRRDVLPEDSGLFACILEHESLFPVALALELAKKSMMGTISVELDSLLRRELCFRQALAAHVRVRDDALWAYLGRPLWMVLAPLHPLFARYAAFS